jgi:transposase
MRHITEETKQAIVKKILNNKDQTITEIALANNVSRPALYRWIKRFKEDGKLIVHREPASGLSTTLAERFKHLQATIGQESAMVGAYCRQHGLYPHQLTQWEADFMTSTVNPKKHQSNTELKELRAENKSLKQLIVRKDKVLAETVALLVLKKKATQIWGDSEED